MNLTYFPFERNKCKVRFGSYSYGHKRVVFKQTSLSPPSLTNSHLSLKVFPLPAKDRWVKRMVASGTQNHVYDGFYIIVDQSDSAVWRFLVPYIGIPFLLVVSGILGFCLSGSYARPAGIDRGPFLAVLLLGAVILYTEAIGNLPHGAEKVPPPIIEAVRLSIAAMFVSFLGFFVMMKMIGYLAEADIPQVLKSTPLADYSLQIIRQDLLLLQCIPSQGERAVLVLLILGSGGSVCFFFYQSYTEATVTYPCHNMIH